MKPKLNEDYENELRNAKTAILQQDFATGWGYLERAHILSQAWPHIRVHLWMLRLSWTRRDVREILGQVLRVIVAGPGFLLGRAPLGNTGVSNVGIFTPMPIPLVLQRILNEN